MVKLCSDIGRDITIFDDYSFTYDGHHFASRPCGNVRNCYMVPFPIFQIEESYGPGDVRRFGTFDVRLEGPQDIIDGPAVVDRQEFGYATRTASTPQPYFTGGRLQYGVSYSRNRGYFLVLSSDFGILVPCEGRLGQPGI